MSSYIMDLRQAVGHRPLLQVGASVIALDGRDRMLLQLRSDNGCWAYAGGSVELDEPVEAAARREFLEETGLCAGDLRLYGIFSGPGTHYVYPNGDEVSCVDIVYLCRDYSGRLRAQPGEVEALRFFAPDELPEPLSPPVAAIIRSFAQALREGGGVI
ncbi:MAG: NUDIX hydrolase [Christensenellales bacterium]